MFEKCRIGQIHQIVFKEDRCGKNEPSKICSEQHSENNEERQKDDIGNIAHSLYGEKWENNIPFISSHDEPTPNGISEGGLDSPKKDTYGDACYQKIEKRTEIKRRILQHGLHMIPHEEESCTSDNNTYESDDRIVPTDKGAI